MCVASKAAGKAAGGDLTAGLLHGKRTSNWHCVPVPPGYHVPEDPLKLQYHVSACLKVWSLACPELSRRVTVFFGGADYTTWMGK
jgi:hypothetical protein